MIHSVPFESNLKYDPSPHPGEDQSAKRAKLEDDQQQDAIMAAELESPEFVPADAFGSEYQISELVPDTPLTSVPVQEVQMEENNDNSCVKIPSFKDKLLNSDSRNPEVEDDDIVLSQGDVSIGLNGNIPTVDFSSHVIEVLNKKMGLAVVVKLLGRKIGYRQLRSQLQNLWKPTGQMKLIDLDEDCFLVRFQDDLDYQNALLSGPWVLFGHYLTVQPWTPSFTPHNHVINQVMGWIRLPKLPARYYHKSVIRSIGGIFGEVIHVDYNTDSGDRGKFARIAVSLDLTMPLILKIMVDGEIIYVEYEGLPTICYNCGKYGRLQEACPALKVSYTGDHSETLAVSGPNAPNPVLQARDSSQFGAWMQVQRRRRPPVRGDRPNEVNGSKKGVSASRYDVLRELVEDEAPQAFVPAGVAPSSKETIQKQPLRQASSQDDTFNPLVYTTQTSTTSLDANYHSVVIVHDPRLPQRRQAVPSTPSGPNNHSPSTLGSNPLSKSRGFKLASGVAIHNLGARPNLNSTGPSISYMKEIAIGIQDVPDDTGENLWNKGVVL
ncbi:hypothetical protein K1719_031208 [Acacia pycnantha]|nr:hypothetical protein K1719_031208 [Acacia pycnantha]